MYNNKQLESLSKLEISDLDKTSLIDLSFVHTDTTLPTMQRLINFLEEIKNPYCFLVGTSTVKVEFSKDCDSLQTILKKHFIEQRNRTFE